MTSNYPRTLNTSLVRQHLHSHTAVLLNTQALFTV